MLISKHYEFKDVNHNVLGKWYRVKAEEIFEKYGLSYIQISWTDNFSLRGTQKYELGFEKGRSVIKDWGHSLAVDAKDCKFLSIGNKERFYSYCYQLIDGNKKYIARNEKIFIEAKEEYKNVLIAYYDDEKMKLVNFPIVCGKFSNGESSLEFNAKDFASAKYLP